MTTRRGAETFNNLFNEEIAIEEKKKGRDQELLDLRDEFMYHRYYYYQAFRGMKFMEAVVAALKEDVFLSEETIPRVIDKYTVEIRRLINAKPEIGYFRKKWPNFDWSVEKQKG
jgi:hypothetical protein